MDREQVRSTFRWVEGHADPWPLFADPAVLDWLGRELAAPFADEDVSAVVGIEARGFVLAPLVAQHLNARFVAIRKVGSVFPGRKHTIRAAADYRGRAHEFSIQADSLNPTDRVLLIDDWAERGSQARAAVDLVQRCGATCVGVSLVVDQVGQHAWHPEWRVESIFRYEELLPSDA